MFFRADFGKDGRYRRWCRTMASSEKCRRFWGRNRRFFAAIATPIARRTNAFVSKIDRLSHRMWLCGITFTYYKNIFVGRCRKGTPCGWFLLFSSAYPLRAVTEQNTQYFTAFFRQKPVECCDVALQKRVKNFMKKNEKMTKNTWQTILCVV